MSTIGIIATPFGWLIKWIYDFCLNYGVAIILFTLIVKIILIPLGISQQRTSAKLTQIKPQLDALNKKYKNDKEKLSQATMELYQKNEINPMSGCLPLLIQLPILLGLYQVIQRPLTYIMGYSAETISELTEKAISSGLVAEGTKQVSELIIAANEQVINFNFLGLDLAGTPNVTSPSALWIIPIAATLITFLTSYVTKWLNGGSTAGDDQSNSMVNSMNVFMPIMTLFITFGLPAGIGLYWFISSLFSIIQQVVVTLYFKKKYAAEPQIVEVKKEKKKK